MRKRHDLPIRNYDGLAAETVQHRVRTLNQDELARLLEYEREHANRPLVRDIITRRLEQVAGGAVPSQGGTGGAA